jgi:8-oxo-dGTP diphosphatase
VVEAAGGVVWRRTAKGVIKVLVVHRPAYQDWSLPKGKLEPGERPLDAARREVAEETGLRCEAGPELPETRYVDRKGRRKRVRYWAMQRTGGSFRPSQEVDQVRWVALDDLPVVLSHSRELPVVEALRDLLTPVG